MPRLARTAAAVVAATIVSALVAAAPALAVDGGVPDRGAHPNVGLLGFDVDREGDTPPFALCSGSVVSDSVFLTAAHCIAAVPDAQWVVTLDGGGPGGPVATAGFYPDDFPFFMTGPVYRSLGTAVHPGFDGSTSHGNDLAVVLFPHGTFAGVTPVRLPRAGVLDELAAEGVLRGRSVTLVGYGVDAQLGPPRYFFAGYRRTATARVQALTPRWLRIQQTAAATGQGGLCYGDSGSPQLLDGTAVSVFSRHARTCQGTSREQRLDTPSARDFLSGFVPLP